ncbi:hypothetical protein ACA910_021289 [Epithemia clementina (nom. ined.)]
MSTTGSTPVGEVDAVLNETFLSQLQVLPKLIVFDLDNTLWTPELYQIRLPRQRGNMVPTVNRDIRLFDDARRILEFLASLQQKGQCGTLETMQLAVASRTSRTQWARQLLKGFTVASSSSSTKKEVPIEALFGPSLIQIQTGSKKEHFANLRQITGHLYTEMLFFDDDASMNLQEISTQLGVLCCHTPRGITIPHFAKALQKYNDLKAGKDARHWMGYILNTDNLGITEYYSLENGQRNSNKESGSQEVDTNRVWTGRIKFYSPQKKFGFVVADKGSHGNRDSSSDQDKGEYFFHESRVPDGMAQQIKTGDKVTFTLSEDRRRPGSLSATIQSFANGDVVALKLSSTREKSSTTSATMETIEMPCFSMSQPFCALLLNGIKTVESRKQPIFQQLPVGSRILVACGRRDWPDQESYLEILSRNEGESSTDLDQTIPQWTRLPRGFAKGQVVGMVTLGPTRRISMQQRANDSKLQRQVLAYADGIGEYCTEISDPTWLTKSFSLGKGQPGMFTVQLPTDCLPQ